jgi:DMSO/TMAO reductase YedYZ molybdopterin-dependent catalytic subunit
MSDEDRKERILRARMRLRERFLARRDREGAAKGSAQGTGPLNAHGLPHLPVGQSSSRKWPVLDLGVHPTVSESEWTLKLDGACDHPQALDWLSLMRFEQVVDVSDFHCVTTWSKLGNRWEGVRLLDIAAHAGPHEDATHVFIHASDGYTTNLPLEEALKGDVLLVHRVNGEPLTREHGGPVRMITPQLYAWKGAKWISRIEFLTSDRLGYWEERGYSNTARPWEDDRYS